jgi:glucoamylase
MTNAPGPQSQVGPFLAAAPKDVVTTGLGSSRVWATLGQGIVTEVYWPSTGEPQIRDLGFFVAGADWFYEVKAQAVYEVRLADPAVPLALITHHGPSTHPYTLTLEVVPDPNRDVLLIRHQLQCDDASARVYPFLASHLQIHPAEDPDKNYSGGSNNWAWTDAGVLFASGAGRVLCLSSMPGFTKTSVGIFGASDLWHDFQTNGRMAWNFTTAGPGFVVLGAECTDDGVLALAFGTEASTAAAAATASFTAGIDFARTTVTGAWQSWASTLGLPAPVPNDPAGLVDALRESATVIRAHEDVEHPGAIVAGLSIPWGDTSNNPGGYHLVWPRDAVEAAFGLMAVGKTDDARRVLDYLVGQQQPDGHWHQNLFPDGTAFWTGVQLDETALPVLLAARLADTGMTLTTDHVNMISTALQFLARHGPLSEQDRWEEDAGGSPFTLAVQVAALVAGAPYLQDTISQNYVLGLADDWNARIEEWTYVEGSYLDELFGLHGHYVRVGPDPLTGAARIANQADRNFTVPSAGVLGLEFMYLARLGLRDPRDQRMTDSARLVDIMLARNVGTGIGYYRYNYDGYGEQVDGANWSGVGVGRVWPLLAGERGHYAVLAGAQGLDQLTALLAMRSPTGLLPEQVWDQPPLSPRNGIPSLPLNTGTRTLSAMPLVWAHSELIKLAYVRATGVPIERTQEVINRYHGQIRLPDTTYWRTGVPVLRLPPETNLVVEDSTPFTLHYGHDGWTDVQDQPSTPSGMGMHGARITTTQASTWSTIDFIRHYPDGSWDPKGNQHVEVGRHRLNRLVQHSS